MQISVVVLVWNGERFLRACLSALLQQDLPLEIIVVDNASTDNSVAIVQEFVPRVCLIRNDRNLGCPAGDNIGIRAAHGDIVVLLNQDTVVQPGWARVIVETFDDPTIGIVGCKALYPDGRGLQHAGGMIHPETAYARHIGWGEQDQGQYDTLTEPDYVTSAACGIRRQVLEKLGELDEQFYPGFYDEIDYCYRARRAGFRIVYQPRAVLYHHESTAWPEGYTRSLAYQRNRLRFVLRHWSVPELEKFFTTERETVETWVLIDELVAYTRACWHNLLAYPLIASQRRQDATLGVPFERGESRWVIETLQSLRQRAHQRIASLIMAHAASAQQNVSAQAYSPVLKGALPETIESANLYTHIEDLESQTVLNLPRLKSRVPVFGRWLDAFRSVWASLVLRHYLEPLLRQQTVFNARTFQAVATLMQATDALSRIQQLHTADEAIVPDALLAMLEHLESIQGMESHLKDEASS